MKDFTLNVKNEEEALQKANKRLAKHPNDVEALTFIGDISYKNGNWEGVMNAYRQIAALQDNPKGVNNFKVNLRLGEAYFKLGQLEEAYKAFIVARSLDRDNFDVNFQLGSLEFQRKNYEKAAQILAQTRAMRPEFIPAVRALGLSLFKLGKFREAVQYMRQAIEMAPGDKESLMTLAQCYREANQSDQAFRIYQHLRPDPVWGAEACLASGIINVESRQDVAAITDFEIGLKHQNITPESKIEMLYQLANIYIRIQDITKAMHHLKEVSALNAEYKDTAVLVEQYQELYSNQNLQIYAMASSSGFLGLCRRLVNSFFPKARVKIAKTAMQGNDWADILAEIDTPKWSDVVMFRFIRTPGSIGELVVRDFHSHLKEAKAGKGICIGIGVYSEEAKRFTDARLIDLIDKSKLVPMLNSLDLGA